MKLRYVFAAIAGLSLSWHLATQTADTVEESASSTETDSDISQYCDADSGTCYDSMEELLAYYDRERPTPSTPIEGDVYEMGEKRFTVSPEVKMVFQTIEAETGIPYNAMVALCGRESDCIPTEINSSSGACGLFQLMTNEIETLYEAFYKYGKDNGYAAEAALVERYNRNQADIDQVIAENEGKPSAERKRLPKAVFGYRPINEAAKEQLIERCKDPLLNTTLWAERKQPDIPKYNAWLGNRTITVGEFIGMNNLGRIGLQKLAKQAWKDAADPGEDMLAVDFFKANRRIYGGNMAANRTLIRHPNGNYKTVREAYASIFKFGGYGELKMVATAELTQ